MKLKDRLRFYDKLLVGDECWEWQGTKTPKGYGQFHLGGRLLYSHRVAYEDLVGPIPEGLEIDHLCRNRGCANPSHLEPVTRRVNQLRGKGVAARHAAVTHCPQGHEYTEANTYRMPSRPHRRICRICKRERDQRRPGNLLWIPNELKTHCPAGHPYDEANTYVNPAGNRECRVCRKTHR